MNNNNTTTKILKIEKEAMTMKYIRKNKNERSFAICYLRKDNILLFQLEIDIHQKRFQCEIIIDYNNKTISLLLSRKEIRKDMIRLIINMTKPINTTKDKILDELNELNHIIPFENIKYQIIPYIKLAIDNKIIILKAYIGNIINKIQQDIIKEIKSKLQEMKDILIIKSMKYNTQSEYHSNIDINAKDIISKAKSFINCYKTVQETSNPQFSYDYSIADIQYKCKVNDYVFINNTTHKMIILASPFQIYLQDKKLNTEVSFTYKNDDDYLFKQSDGIVIISKESFCFVGISENNKNNSSFGVEQAKDHIYLGLMSGNKFNGLGLLLTSSFIYRGLFKNGMKNDDKAIILIEPNIKYNGSIVDDSLQGKGIYEYQSDIRLIQKIIFEWKNNRVEGKTQIIYSNQDSFEGNIGFNNKPIGKWVYHSNNKQLPDMSIDYESKPINYNY